MMSKYFKLRILSQKNVFHQFCPSTVQKKRAENKDKKVPFAPHVKKVRSTIKCSRCCKVRLLFAKRKLEPKLVHLLADHKESITFICGQELDFPDTIGYKDLKERVFLDRTKLCDSPFNILLQNDEKNQVPPCGWCPQNVSNDLVLKYRN